MKTFQSEDWRDGYVSAILTDHKSPLGADNLRKSRLIHEEDSTDEYWHGYLEGVKHCDEHAALVAVAVAAEIVWNEYCIKVGHDNNSSAVSVALGNLAAVRERNNGLCQGCYKSPCICLPDDCDCNP